MLNLVRSRFQKSINLATVLLFLLLGLSACFGYSMGYFSVPYVGEKEPRKKSSSSNFYMRQMKKLEFEKFQLAVDLNNARSTSKTAWMGPIPLSTAPKKPQKVPVYVAPPQDNFPVEIGFITEEKDILFRPGLVTLIIDGVSFNVTRTQVRVYINHEIKITDISNDPISLLELEGAYVFYFLLWFETSKPTPDQMIELDLIKAIQVLGQERGQMIHFKKARYRHGYT